jgi:tetratricopeptide (TPR) repeat protein
MLEWGGKGSGANRFFLESLFPHPPLSVLSCLEAVMPDSRWPSTGWPDSPLERFDEAWQLGTAPRLEDFLPEPPDSGPLAVLGDLIHADLEYRLKGGEGVRVEDYLARYPRVAGEEGLVLDLLAWEFELRHRREPGLQVDEYLRRFPHLEVDLRNRLQVPSTSCSLPASGPLTAPPGYELLGELGRGGMGVVYRARQVRLNRVVALKMILSGAHAGAEERLRFLAEAEVIASLPHPGIVQVYEFGAAHGAPWFALEYCPGGTLAAKLGSTTLPPREAASVVAQVARAVQAAHEKQVLHRDLKPSNVLLDVDGRPRVVDFGLARRVEGGSGLTQTGVVVGTPSYMAPEQARGRKDIDARSDVYSVGAILYECLSGRPPFKAPTAYDTILQVLSEEPVSPRRLNPNAPPDLETICLKCLEKEPGKRYASAGELADDLARFLGGEPIRARPVPAWERAAKWARRRPTAAALLGTAFAAFLCASAGVLFFALYKAQQSATLLRQAERRQEIDRFFGRGRDALAAGRQALRERKDGDAAKHFEGAEHSLDLALNALKDAGTSAATEELRRQITKELDHVRRQRDEVGRRLQMGPRLARLRQDRDDVLFEEISLTPDRPGNLERIRRRAPEALRRFGLTIGESPAEAVQALERQRGWFASEAERKQAAAWCFEVLLAWAEAEAEWGLLPGRPADAPRAGARAALRLLDTANALTQAHGTPTPRAYHRRRARCHDRLGSQKEAAAERALAEKSRPETALDHFLAALEYYLQGKLAQAADASALALRKQPDHFWAQYLHAVSQLKRSRWVEAKLGLNACLARRPTFFWALILRGVAHAGLTEFAAAEADFKESLAGTADPLARYLVLTNRGVLWAQQQRWDDAAADLKAATELRPDNHLAYVTLSEVCRQRNDLEGAVKALDRAVACQPGEATLYYTRARLHLTLGNREEARRDLERAIPGMREDRDGDRLPSALVELGVLKHRAGQTREALADFDAALAVRPHYPPAHRQRAQTLMKLKKYREAGEALDRYLKYGEPVPEVYLARGMIHGHLREHASAVEAYTRALMLKADPKSTTHAEALKGRGWAFLQLEAPRLALADFEAALKQRPADVKALCGRGNARVLRGQVSEAVRDAREALRLAGKGEVELQAACIYARAAGLLSLTPRARGPARPESSYEDRAAELVCQALRRVSPEKRAEYWRTHIQDDPALEVIRRHPRVLRLVPGFEK